MLVNDSNYIIKDIPTFNPLSLDYKKFWKKERERCLNGLWVSGKYMPGPLYFYINHWQILLNETEHSKSKIIKSPLLRDIEWGVIRGWVEARGFSGFEKEEEFTSNRSVKEYLEEKDSKMKEILYKTLPKECFNSKGDLKKYESARDCLEKIHKTDKGLPLFQNQAKNFMLLGCRGFGKSYIVSGAVIAYEFLFIDNSEVVVGAGQAKYSNETLDKVKMGLNNLKGEIKYNGKLYPAPFSKKYSGNWNPGGEISAGYKENIAGNWVKRGSGSRVKNRSFKDNPFAANGTRPGVMIFEEVGMFNNLEQSYGASVECMMNGNIKFGSAFFIGTGGDMEGGGTIGARKFFYDPEAYDIITYTDIWEPRDKPIAYFMPAYLGLNENKYTDTSCPYSSLITDEEAAKISLLKKREILKKSSSRKPLDNEMQNKPLIPSEAFLVTSGNLFPVSLLMEQLAKVESKGLHDKLASFGEIDASLKFNANTSSRALIDYPINSKSDNSGCITIYEFPPKEREKIPYGMYIAGLDPYRVDESDSSPSVGAMYIYKRYTEFDETHNKIVASYIGRPNTLSEFHENCRRLLVYYNAECLYENEINNFYQFLESKGEDFRLTDQPDALIKEIIDNSKVKRSKGIHMTDKIKKRGILLLRDWLLEVRGHDVEGNPILNLHHLNDPGLLNELIQYNDDMNFDRVIAIIMCMMLDVHLEKVKVKNLEEAVKRDPFWDKKLFTRSKKFTNKLPTRKLNLSITKK